MVNQPQWLKEYERQALDGLDSSDHDDTAEHAQANDQGGEKSL
jgi:hypothetical protein